MGQGEISYAVKNRRERRKRKRKEEEQIQLTALRQARKREGEKISIPSPFLFPFLSWVYRFKGEGGRQGGDRAGGGEHLTSGEG